MQESEMPPKTDRQTLMFSATFPQGVQQLAGEFLNDHVFITVGKVGAANQDIQQELLSVGQYEKKEKLIEFITADMKSFQNTGKLKVYFLDNIVVWILYTYFCRWHVQQENVGIRGEKTRCRFRGFVFIPRRHSDY